MEANLRHQIHKIVAEIEDGAVERPSDSESLLQVAEYIARFKNNPKLAGNLIDEALTGLELEEAEKSKRIGQMVVLLLRAANDESNESESRKLRDNVFKWLNASVEQWAAKSDTEQEADAGIWAKTFATWLIRPDFETCRDAKWLDQMSNEERTRWESLWAKVQDATKR